MAAVAFFILVAAVAANAAAWPPTDGLEACACRGAEVTAATVDAAARPDVAAAASAKPPLAPGALRNTAANWPGGIGLGGGGAESMGTEGATAAAPPPTAAMVGIRAMAVIKLQKTSASVAHVMAHERAAISRAFRRRFSSISSQPAASVMQANAASCKVSNAAGMRTPVTDCVNRPRSR